MSSEKENPYPGLRQMSFDIDMEKLNIAFESDELRVYGVIAEWDMGSATVTMVAFITGDTSLYLSSGGGFIGAGKHQDVSEMVFDFVNLSNTMLELASQDDSTDLPGTEEIHFHFKTNKGKYLIRDTMENMNTDSDNAQFFGAVNQVLALIRLKSGQE